MYVSAGTTTIRNSTVVKHGSGSEYDINNVGGTVYVENGIYQTSSGTITPLRNKAGILADIGTLHVGESYYATDEGVEYIGT